MAKKQTLEEYYSAMSTGHRSAKLPWQERFGIAAYNKLRPVADWAEERKTGLQSIAGPLVNYLIEPTMSSAMRAAEGEPNVYADFSSENPMNWRLKPEIVDPALLAADVADGPLPLAAGVAGSIRGVKRIPPLYHGRTSITTNKTVPESTLLKEGFTKGASSEGGFPGTSMSDDPTVSFFGFADEKAKNMNMVKANIGPEEVWNLPPDLYLAGVQPNQPGALYKKPNPTYNEGEWFAKRMDQDGNNIVDIGDSLYEEPGVTPSISLVKNTPDKTDYYKEQAMAVDAAKDALKLTDVPPKGMVKKYDEVLGIDNWVYDDVPPLSRPEAEKRMKNLMGKIGNARGNRAAFRDLVDNVANNITSANPNTFFDSAFDPEDLLELRQEAMRVREMKKSVEKKAQEHQVYIDRLGGYKPSTLESFRSSGLENPYSEEINVALREYAREHAIARNRFYEMLNNKVYKQRRFEQPKKPDIWNGMDLSEEWNW